MDVAEVVVPDVQRHGGGVVPELPGKRRRPADEPLQVLAHGQVLPLHVARRDPGGVGVADDRSLSVAPRALDQHGVVHLGPEGPHDGIDVGLKPIAGDLGPVEDALPEVEREGVRGGRFPLAHAEGDDCPPDGIEPDIRVLVPQLRRIAGLKVALFLSDVAPDFVEFEDVHLQVAQQAIVEALARLSDRNAQIHDGFPVYFAEPRRSADGDALSEGRDDADLLCPWQRVHWGPSPSPRQIVAEKAGRDTPGKNQVLSVAAVIGLTVPPRAFVARVPPSTVAESEKLRPSIGMIRKRRSTLPTKDSASPYAVGGAHGAI